MNEKDEEQRDVWKRLISNAEEDIKKFTWKRMKAREEKAIRIFYTCINFGEINLIVWLDRF